MCQWCRKDKPIEDFYNNRKTNDGLDAYCKPCRIERNKASREKRRLDDIFSYKLANLRNAARTSGAFIDLMPNDLEEIWTGKCAIFGTPLDLWVKRGLPESAEIDKTVPALGYIKGNIAWVCHRANRLKDNATLAELETVINYVKGRI